MKKLFTFYLIIIFSFTVKSQTNNQNSWNNRLYDSTYVHENNLNYSPPPKRFKKHLKQPQSFPNFLDSSSIYLFQNTDSSCFFIRFYSDSKCFVSEKYKSTPTGAEFKQLDYGRLCMYNYSNKKGENRFIIEHFNNIQSPASYVYKYFKENRNSILHYKGQTMDGPNMGAKKINITAKRITVKFDNYSSDEHDKIANKELYEDWELYLSLTAKGNNCCLVDDNYDTVWDQGKELKEWGYWRFTNQEDADFHLKIELYTKVNLYAIPLLLHRRSTNHRGSVNLGGIVNPIKKGGYLKIIDPKSKKVLKIIYKDLKATILKDHSK